MSTQKTGDRLRKELQEVLRSEPIDYDKLLVLSSRLVSLDTEYVRFSVDAGLISRLGRELVARQETAVSELVKNAYDADATWVELSFEKAEKPGGILKLEDDGSGMNKRELIDGFMRLSSTEKIENPISPIFKRRRAGQKGIGRFAAQRLGNRLTIVTQKEKLKKALKVEIDWGRFASNVDLVNIRNSIQEIEKTRSEGTTLTIEGLIDSWSDESISRVYRYITDLIQPFPLSKKLKASKVDPGFDVRIYKITDDGKPETVADVEKIIYKFAIADIEGFVDNSGLGGWSLNSKQLGLKEDAVPIGADRDDSGKRFKYLRNINFRAYYYIYNAGYIPPIQNKAIRDMAYERGGIRVYRNGFRVLPYGEPLNDWLSLDASSGRRLILPPHANINFLGFVEILDPEGKSFQETSSREGLVENEAYKELVNFTSRVLKAAVLAVAEARNRKKTTSQKKWKAKRTPSARLKETTEQLAKLGEELRAVSSRASIAHSQPAVKRMAQRISDFVLELESTAADQEEETSSRIQEEGMLRVLASLGLIIGEFTHEVRHRFPPIIADAQYFRSLHKTGSHNKVARSLIDHISTFKAYTAYFDRAVSENARRELVLQELSVVLRGFHKIIQPAADRYGIAVHEPKVYGYDVFTPPMHPSEWVSILFNLFTNSHKAIKKAEVKGEIFMRAGRVEKNVYLEFSDNGIGIAPEIAPRIFDAFFTTTSPADPMATEQEENIGTGLGLKIIKDIVTSYGGDITLVSAPRGYKTCFRIELPRATEREIEEYGY
jgi:signal transduction histidine kinase